MRTTIALEKVGRLVEGRDENPFELLGPHEVLDGGRRALAVRAFLPTRPRLGSSTRPAIGRAASHAADPSGRVVRGDLSAAASGRGWQVPAANSG